MVLGLLVRRRRRRARAGAARRRKVRWLASGFAVGAACTLALHDGTVLPPGISAGLTVWNGAREIARAVRPPLWRQAPTRRATGLVRVVDGDTVELATGRRRVKVRLRALHAPELPSPEGTAARAAMERLAAKGPFTCVAASRRLSHGRTVADCRTARGEDVATAMIRSGVATHCERYGRADLGKLAQSPRLWRDRPAYCRRR